MDARAGRALAGAVLVALFSCGGQQTAAPPPPEPAQASEPSGLSITVDRDNAYAAKGEAFAQFDPAQQMLAVFVFSEDAKPTPSCEELSLASLNLSAGGFAVIRLRGYATKEAGTFPITGGGFIAGNVQAHETRMASSGPEASNLVIDKFDSHELVASAKSDAKAEMQIHGSFRATVCPDGALGAAGQPPATSPSFDVDAGAPEEAAPPPKRKKKKRKHAH